MRSPIHRRVFLPLLLAFAWLHPHDSTAAPKPADELIKLAGLKETLSSLAAGLQEQAVQADPSLPAAQKDAFREGVKKSYTAEKIVASVTASITRDAAQNPERVAEALAWFRGATAKKLTAMQVAAAAPE